VAQVVWGFELLASPDADMQTVIVINRGARSRGGISQPAGRSGLSGGPLELPFLTNPATHGTEVARVIYPGVGGDKFSCLWPGV